ncbi:prepilin-type N-terminal cleavage/methylation domain-containing protein [Opitutaceae bacterium TAV4]|nr:prepilin-type N-terminal cleavage/methylation domain-containing protein [Opitutaceae bacterium TAV4]RRK00825.1 prepilin-type N-terminal cleavage/methylation domain-containing protein [Opitutaceae bacterium TAV3]
MKQQLKHEKTSQGFTLTELLVAIGIITLLATLSFPFVLQARMAAWKAVSISSLRQLTTANLVYAIDRGRFVSTGNVRTGNTARWSGQKISGNNFNPIKGLLSPYLGRSNKITSCPLLVHMIQKQKAGYSFELDGGGFGYNDYIGGNLPCYPNDAVGLSIARKPDEIQNPSKTIMFGTSAYAIKDGVQEYPFLEVPFQIAKSGALLNTRPSPSLHFRFNGNALVSWCDGRVTQEKMDPRTPGANPHGGDADKERLGWIGPDEENGYWNPHIQH